MPCGVRGVLLFLKKHKKTSRRWACFQRGSCLRWNKEDVDGGGGGGGGVHRRRYECLAKPLSRFMGLGYFVKESWYEG